MKGVMPVKAVIVAVAVGAALVCAVGPNFQPPEAPSTDRYGVIPNPLNVYGRF